MELKKRKHPRLKQYDYSAGGYYFITICTANKQKILCDIVGRALAPAETKLTALGKIVHSQIDDIDKRFENVSVDKFVIMPNHIHAIIKIEETAGASARPTLSDIVRAFKSLVSITYKKQGGIGNLWQTSFYDHIIRDENDYLRIWNYIETNPAKWAEDVYYL